MSLGQNESSAAVEQSEFGKFLMMILAYGFLKWCPCFPIHVGDMKCGVLSML